MEPDKSQETKSNIKKLLYTFAGSSTLHGLHFLVDSLSFVRKLIWFLLLCGATAIFVYLAFWGWTKWRRNEVFLTTKIEFNEPSSVPFPAVTICNKNMMKKSRILGTDSQRYLDALDYSLSFTEQLKQGQDINSSFNIEQAVLQNGHQTKDMVKSCKAGHMPCKKFDQSFDVMSGLCHTLNGNGGFMLTRKGASFGVTLLLDAEPDEYCGEFSRKGVGFSIMVHDQSTKPTPELDGFDVPPGFATNFILTRKEIKRLPAPYPSKCGEIKLQSSKSYSITSCYMETLTNKTVDKCGCRLLGMPVIGGKSKKFCSTTEILKCAFPLAATFTYPKECPPQCNTVYYDIKTSSLVFPSGDVLEKTSDDIKNMYNSSNETNTSFHDWYRSRFALVNIFFHSTDTEVMREVPAYDFIDLAAGLGGNMGLFLGCSVLTLFEFIDILVVVFVEWYMKKGRNTQKISVQPKERKLSL